MCVVLLREKRCGSVGKGWVTHERQLAAKVFTPFVAQLKVEKVQRPFGTALWYFEELYALLHLKLQVISGTSLPTLQCNSLTLSFTLLCDKRSRSGWRVSVDNNFQAQLNLNSDYDFCLSSFNYQLLLCQPLMIGVKYDVLKYLWLCFNQESLFSTKYMNSEALSASVLIFLHLTLRIIKASLVCMWLSQIH